MCNRPDVTAKSNAKTRLSTAMNTTSANFVIADINISLQDVSTQHISTFFQLSFFSQDIGKLVFLSARRYASAVWKLSPGVCLSVTNRCSTKTSERIELVSTQRLFSTFLYTETVLLPPDSFSRLKMANKCVCGWVSAPDPAWGAYSAPPDPLAGLRGPTSKWRGKGKGREGRRRRDGDASPLQDG